MKQLYGGIWRDFAADAARERAKAETVRLASIALREHEIGRVCSRYELDSDERATARQKATEIIGGAE